MLLDVSGRERQELRVHEPNRFRFRLCAVDGPAILEHALDHPHSTDTIGGPAMDEHRLIGLVRNRAEEVGHHLGIW
jgi:hypothetical protein